MIKKVYYTTKELIEITGYNYNQIHRIAKANNIYPVRRGKWKAEDVKTLIE